MCLLLAAKNTHYEGLNDVEGCLRVRVRELFGAVHELVASKEELRDVSSLVMHQIELATRVQKLVPLQVEHQVVKNDKRPTKLDLLIDILRLEDRKLVGQVFTDNGVIKMTHRVLVTHTIASFTDGHENDKRQEAEHA